MVEKLWRYVKPFSYNTSVSRTDRRTDGRTDRITISISRVSSSMLTRDKNGFRKRLNCEALWAICGAWSGKKVQNPRFSLPHIQQKGNVAFPTFSYMPEVTRIVFLWCICLPLNLGLYPFCLRSYGKILTTDFYLVFYFIFIKHNASDFGHVRKRWKSCVAFLLNVIWFITGNFSCYLSFWLLFDNTKGIQKHCMLYFLSHLRN